MSGNGGSGRGPIAGRPFSTLMAPTGRWARLFAATPDFIGTHLLGPEEESGYWLTIDRWASREAFDRFQKSHGKTYRRIDAEMREIAGEEEFIGAFEEP